MPRPDRSQAGLRPATGSCPHLKCDVVVVLPHADDGRDAEVGFALQQIDERLPLGGHVRMGIDDGGHHGLAGQVHARCACRHLHLTAGAHLRDAAVLDKERGALDGLAVANNEPRAFVDGCPALLLTLGV